MIHSVPGFVEIGFPDRRRRRPDLQNGSRRVFGVGLWDSVAFPYEAEKDVEVITDDFKFQDLRNGLIGNVGLLHRPTFNMSFITSAVPGKLPDGLEEVIAHREDPAPIDEAGSRVACKDVTTLRLTEVATPRVWREDGSLASFMRAWLDRHCPGWGLLPAADLAASRLGSGIEFAQAAHAEKFEAAISILGLRAEHDAHHDTWAAEERFIRANDLDHFRWEFPKSRRLLADYRWPIWSEGMPRLRVPVVHWLDGMCPGWRHLPGTYYIGFATMEDADAFVTEWR